MKLLVTGVLGFIFSNFVRRVPCVAGIDIGAKKQNLDNLYTLPGNHFYLADITDAHAIDNIFTLERPDVVVGGAAESFVDDAIRDVMPFLSTNVVGTQVLVNACLAFGARYVHISTDEVYGQQLVRSQAWTEESPMAPRNPYAASKACAELVVRAAAETHGLNFNVVRSCNVYGPRQKKENLIPHVIHGLLEQRPIRIHGNGLNFRQYIHVNDVIDGIMHVIRHGAAGETYNIGDELVLSNLEMVERLATHVGRKALVQHVEDRKGHDFGYRVSSRKLRRLGWGPKVPVDLGLAGVVTYYKRHVGQAFAAA